MMKRRLVVAALAALPVFSQDAFKKMPDFGVYGGLQDWGLWKSRFSNNPGSDLVKGGTLGARAGWDLTKHWGFEASYGYGVNNLRLFPQGFPGSLAFGARNHHVALNPMLHLNAPNSAIRPFVTAGFGGLWFDPTGEARAQANLPQNAARGASQLDLKFGPAFNWGGGVKVNASRLLQFRLDARNILSPNPHFILPDAPVVPGGVFIAPKGVASALQLTGGVGLRLGNKGYADSPRGKTIKLALNADPSPIPSGTTRNVQAITDLPPEVTPKFVWSVNGVTMDTTGPNFALRGEKSGQNRVCANATASGYNAASECIDLTVGPASVLRPVQSIGLTMSANPPTVNPGATSTVSVSSDLPAGTTLNYSWTVNGEKVSETGPIYTFNTAGRQPGTYKVCVTATAAGYADKTECTDVVIRECGKPTFSASATSGEIFAGERVSLPFVAQPGPCAAPVQLSYSASEGTVTPTATGATFDSSSVAFDAGARSRLQRKTVTVTATARDSLGNTATATSQVVVKLAPAAQRLDDIVFSARSSRVNNCAKRLLLEVLVPKLQQDPTAKVVLVGHTDDSDRGAAVRRGKKSRRSRAPAVTQLDRARVFNAAAVISAGAGICPSIELDRIKLSYAGSTQVSQPMPTMCGGSTQPRGKGGRDSREKYRRVEVWLVPDGSPMPATGAVVRDAPAASIRALKCPK